MSPKNYWFVSGFYSIGSKVGTLLFGFGSFFILVRGLEKTQFGIWALFLTITTLIETSRNGLIQNALIKFLHSNSEDLRDRIITSSWFLNISFSIIITLLLLLFAQPVSDLFNSQELSTMFWWYILTLLQLVPISQFNYLQQAHFSFSGIFWTISVRQGSFFIIVLLTFLFDYRLSLVELVKLQTVCTGVSLIVAYLCARSFLTSKLVWDWVIIKRIFSFGKYVMGTNLFSLAYKSTDQMLVGYLTNPVSVAYYNSAIRVSNLIEYPSSSVAEIVYPKTTRQYEYDKEKASKYFYEMGVGLTMTLTLPVVIFTLIFADTIVFLIAGPEYAASADIMRITILFGLFTPFSRQFGAAMDSSGRPHINFFVLVISFLLNFLTNYIGISHHGVLGAAYGTLASYIVMGIASYIIMYKIFGVSFKNVIQQMFGFYFKLFIFFKEKIKLKI